MLVFKACVAVTIAVSSAVKRSIAVFWSGAVKKNSYTFVSDIVTLNW